MLSASFLPLVLAAAVPHPSPAQLDGPAFEPILEVLLDQEADGTPNSPLTSGSPLDLTITGDFNGDATPDLLFLDQGRLRFSTAPGLFRAARFVWDSDSPIGTISQLATLPRLGIEDVDHVLAVTETGVHRFWRESTELVWLHSQVAGAEWADATDLRVRLDEVRGTRLATMVSSAGDKVGLLEIDEIGQPLVQSALVPVGAVIDEALVVDLFGDGTLEFVVGSATTFAVLDGSGGLLYGYPLEFETMEYFRRSDGLDAVAWIAKGPDGSGGKHDFLVVDSLGQAVDALGLPLTNQFLGSMAIQDLVAADLDDDGDSDLVLLSDISPHVHAIENDGGAGLLDPTGTTWLEHPYFHGPGEPVQSVKETQVEDPPVVADVNSDGLADLIFADEHEGSFEAALGTPGTQASSIAGENDIFWLDLVDARVGMDSNNLETGEARSYLFLPVHVPTLPTPPAGSNLVLEVVSWGRPLYADYIDPVADSRLEWTLVEGTSIPVYFEWSGPFDSHYIMVRPYAEEIATGRTVRVYEPNFFGLATNAANELELIAQEGAATTIDVPFLTPADNWIVNGVDYSVLNLDPSVQTEPDLPVYDPYAAITVSDPIVKKVRRLPSPPPTSEPTTNP